MTETIEDIVKWIRDENPPAYYPAQYGGGTVPNKMRDLADRIEAAFEALEADRDNWRRQALDEDAMANEATCRKSLQVGNAAAMREALLRCDAIAQLPETRELQSIQDMRNIIKRALAAPPRNCDRFTTAKEAMDAWLKLDNDSDGANDPFDWLFATAEEGGAS